jgi:hypothetical protein
LALSFLSGLKRTLLRSVTKQVFGATTLPLFVACLLALEKEQALLIATGIGLYNFSEGLTATRQAEQRNPGTRACCCPGDGFCQDSSRP